MIPLIIILAVAVVGGVFIFFRHQRKLKLRAYLMQEAVRNRDFSFRLAPRGLFFGEKAMQETLNNVGQELRRQIAAQEVESWKKLTRVLTHEIMNATAPIASISQAFLNREDVKGTQLEDGIKAIHETTLGLSMFVENYRKLTALQEPQPTTFRLKPMVEGIAKIYPALEWQIDVAEEAEITTDEGLLRQVLINLTKNAQEAGARRIAITPAAKPPGTERGTNRLGTGRGTNRLGTGRGTSRLGIERGTNRLGTGRGLMISNDGAPIPAELRRDIFTPFFTTKRTGSGIGLSLSRQILVTQGGDLSLADKPEPGYHTTFIVAL